MYRLATQEDVFMFTLMGHALLNTQVLEETLSVSITLKADVGHPRKVSKEKAYELLEKHRSLPLGAAINVALQKELYTDKLQKGLKAFLKERNWLVHKSISDIYAPTGKNVLFQRISSIAQEAYRLQMEMEDDWIEFSESIGLDMSRVRAEIKQWDHRYR